MKYIIFLIATIFVSSLIMMIIACGNSISNTPEQAINEYFQAANDKDCDKHLDLHSSNFKYKPGASHAEELKACQEQLQVVQNIITVRIDEVSTRENRAVAKGELTMITEKQQVTDKIIVRLIVEDGEWKLDKITYSDASSQLNRPEPSSDSQTDSQADGTASNAMEVMASTFHKEPAIWV